LFLRRESPPRTPPRQRRVLLDAGIRTWGVPRVFVAAVGLALAAQSDPQLAVSTYSAAAGEAEPVDFRTKAGLKRHLAVLDHRLHPAESLAVLSKAATSGRGSQGRARKGRESIAAGRLNHGESRPQLTPDPDECDLILVTTDDTLADRDFQRWLYEAGPRTLYQAAVSRDGRFQLLLRSFRGTKPICQAKFDLDEVLKPRPTSPKLLDPSRDPEFPAIFSGRMPLRLSCPVDVERSWLVHPGTVASYTRDGRLLLWDSPQHGARQIAHGLPEGSLMWCSSAWEDDTLRLVLGKRSQRGLVSVTYDRRQGTCETKTLKLTGYHPQHVIGYQGHGYVFYSNEFDILSLQTGELVANHALRLYPETSSLFFPSNAHSQRRNWVSIANFIQPVFTETDDIKLLALHHAFGHEGPLGITDKGEILDPATSRLTPINTSLLPNRRHFAPPYSLVGVSRDGLRAMIRPVQVPNLAMLVEVPSGTARECLAFDPAALERPMFEIAKPRVVRSRFSAIGVGRDRQLVLVSRRNHLWPILLDVGNRTIRFPKDPHTSLLLDKLEFEPIDSERGFELHVVEWPDGSRAWLDGRGMLHLDSSNPQIPQCSLILTDGPLAGWLSDGRVFGPPYWLQGQQPTSAETVYREVLQPFVAQLG
ncbi:MAG TPA: hypothetical protein VFV87_16140, partial [Pirellulaceae bacterium]|nr:hypothetical protein [Pirellulaceae bacterium]